MLAVEWPGGGPGEEGRRVSGPLREIRRASSTAHYQPGLDGEDRLTHTYVLRDGDGIIHLLIPHRRAVGSVHDT